MSYTALLANKINKKTILNISTHSHEIKVSPSCRRRRVVSSVWFYNAAFSRCAPSTGRLKLAKAHQAGQAGEITLSSDSNCAAVDSSHGQNVPKLFYSGQELMRQYMF